MGIERYYLTENNSIEVTFGLIFTNKLSPIHCEPSYRDKIKTIKFHFSYIGVTHRSKGKHMYFYHTNIHYTFFLSLYLIFTFVLLS